MHRRREATRVGRHQLAHVLPRHTHDIGHVGQSNQVRRVFDDSGRRHSVPHVCQRSAHGGPCIGRLAGEFQRQAPRLASATASLVAMRRDPGLFRAVDVSVDLIKKKLMPKEDISRLIDGLSELIIETDYQKWRIGDFHTPTLTYTRANAYRLARTLRQSGHTDTIINDWIAAGSMDPIPEVRYAPDEHD